MKLVLRYPLALEWLILIWIWGIITQATANIIEPSITYVEGDLETSKIELEQLLQGAASSPNKRQSSTYWYENVSHGNSSTAAPGYAVFRNVRDYGAAGDGVTDDTDAINAAISDGDRCGPGCNSSTTTPAVVYFPSGTYLVSSPIQQYYYTQFVGNPIDVPTLLADSSFSGIAVIDSDIYSNGTQWFSPQKNNYRQIRNFIIDISNCPMSTSDGQTPTGIHWQVAKATSLQNIHFIMSQASGTTHRGIFMEDGSGGFLGNLTFTGGATGMSVGNQQFTSSNLRFDTCTQAIEVDWDWGWTWKDLYIYRCSVGINVTSLTSSANLHNQGVGSITILDSVFDTVSDAIVTGNQTSIMLENVQFVTVSAALTSLVNGTILPGALNTRYQSVGIGTSYYMDGSNVQVTHLDGGGAFSGQAAADPSLTDDSGWFSRPKPQYETLTSDDFVNVKDAGAQGDAQNDDTIAINNTLASAAGSKVVFFPHGTYMVTDTIYIPPGSRIVGEAWSEIMAAGDNFTNITSPHTMVRVGLLGDVGDVEISDMLFTVNGPTAGAVLVEWNIAQASQGSAAMWDSHFRVGGATGTDLESTTCPANDMGASIYCIGAALMMQISSSATAYLENIWIWTASYDMDSPDQEFVSVYTARGLLVESQGPVWLWGTSVEHSTLYQYQFYSAKNIFAANMETETPYYQPAPAAPEPFTGAFALPGDPTFVYCDPTSTTCRYAWGLDISNSEGVMIYGAGLYSWYQNYSQICIFSDDCQDRLVRVMESDSIYIVNLFTKGVWSMLQAGGSADTPAVDVFAADNPDYWMATILEWVGKNISGVADTPNSIVTLPTWIWYQSTPVVSCHIPCTIQPPPLSLNPIVPPVYSSMISDTMYTATPPPIATPIIPVSPIIIATPGQIVNPIITSAPSIPVPAVVVAGIAAAAAAAAPIVLVPPPILLPIPPSMNPDCFLFCDDSDWPPQPQPIIVNDGDPVPMAQPAPDTDPDSDDNSPDGECEYCQYIPEFPTGYPTVNDLPPWGQSNTTVGGNCTFEGPHKVITTVIRAPGAQFYAIDVFGLLNIGPAYGMSIDGASIALESAFATGWTSTVGVDGIGTSIEFDVPTDPLPNSLIINMLLNEPPDEDIIVELGVQPSTTCGGTAWPAQGGLLFPMFPTNTTWPEAECQTRGYGAGVDMADCLMPYGSGIIQGQTIEPDSSFTTENPSANCVRFGQQLANDNATIAANWCVLHETNGCAFVVADQVDTANGLLGWSTINGTQFRDFSVDASNNCSDLNSDRGAVGYGPNPGSSGKGQVLCLTSADTPHICTTPNTIGDSDVVADWETVPLEVDDDVTVGF